MPLLPTLHPAAVVRCSSAQLGSTNVCNALQTLLPKACRKHKAQLMRHTAVTAACSSCCDLNKLARHHTQHPLLCCIVDCRVCCMSTAGCGQVVRAQPELAKAAAAAALAQEAALYREVTNAQVFLPSCTY